MNTSHTKNSLKRCGKRRSIVSLPTRNNTNNNKLKWKHGNKKNRHKNISECYLRIFPKRFNPQRWNPQNSKRGGWRNVLWPRYGAQHVRVSLAYFIQLNRRQKYIIAGLSWIFFVSRVFCAVLFSPFVLRS